MPTTNGLAIKRVKRLGRSLIAAADCYPTCYLTERDFYPLVIAFLNGAGIPCKREFQIESGGVIDFRTGGTNPGLLELVVVPRQFTDKHCTGLQISGHSQKTQSQPSATEPEITKLVKHTSRMAIRCLLIVNFGHQINAQKMAKQYLNKWPANGNHPKVVVAVVSRTHAFHFNVAGP
jgi:hypothetical protein